jgi:hypothetical protein
MLTPKLGLAVASLSVLATFACGVLDKPKARDIGHSCDTTVDAGAAQAVYNANAAECATGLCVKPAVQNGAVPPTPMTGATCSVPCLTDADCGGETRDRTNVNDTRCQSGFTCAVPFDVGPLCCKKMCVCKDFLPVTGAQTPAACDPAKNNGPVCTSTPASGVGVETDIFLSVSTQRQVDLTVMVDNSPGMPAKVTKLNAQFAKLITALKDPSDGTLPDLRVAILDSDLGTGCRYATGSCGSRPLTNSNDPGCFGDQGKFLMLNQPVNCNVDSNAWFLEVKSGQNLGFPAGADINTTFACLTSNLGEYGCGEESQLQAFEFGLAATGVGNEEQQKAFLRPNAYLGLVFFTDEDDCSVSTNYGMMGDLQGLPPPVTDLRNESASLRCATRGHMCGGMNLSEMGPLYPTQNAYAHPFNDCMARTDTCPNPTDGTGSTDTSQWTSCAPLKNVEHLANEIKHLKQDPDNQILVAGIFGWPRTDADMAKAVYKIDKVPNPNSADTQHPQVFDYWPICYDPDHYKDSDWTTFDAVDAGWGATGGLRNAAFVDEFGANGLKFSICERDFSNAMTSIGGAIAKKLQNLCVDYKLVDTDEVTPDVQPDCHVAWRTPGPDPKDATRTIYQDGPPLVPCPAGATNGNVATDCWQLLADKQKCPVTGQWLSVLRTAEEIAQNPRIPAGTKIAMQCRTCPNLSSPDPPPAGCAYQP